MPRIIKKISDEHENMEPVFSNKKIKFIVISSIIATIVLVCVVIGIIKEKRKRQRIEEIIASIQNEIYLKQCYLDKMYCCEYKDKDACEKWINASCTEEDGSLEINCNTKN